MDEKKLAEVAASAAAAAVETAFEARDAAAQKVADRRVGLEARVTGDHHLVRDVEDASTDLLFAAKTCLELIDPPVPGSDASKPAHLAKYGPDDEGVKVRYLLGEAQRLIEGELVKFLTATGNLRDYVRRIEGIGEWPSPRTFTASEGAALATSADRARAVTEAQ